MTPTPISNFLDRLPFDGVTALVIIIAAGVLVILILVWVLLFFLSPRRKQKQARSRRTSTIPVTRLPESIAEEVPAIAAEPAVPAAPTPPDFGLHLILPNGKKYTISKLPLSIGRGEECNLVLPYESVSIAHARIDYDPMLEGVIIEDIGSLNGIRINDQPTRKNLLRHGDRITLGKATLVFQDTGFIPPQ